MTLEPKMVQVTICELKPQMKHLNIVFKVLEIGEVREVISRYDGSVHRLSDIIVGDNTGIIVIPVWDELIERIETGKHYKLTNGYTNLFQQHLRLSIGRFATLEESDEHFEVIPISNNMSLELHKAQAHTAA